jgi:hypothetical protein
MGCCGGKRYIGNFLFKPIEVKNFDRCNHEKLDTMFIEIEGFVKKSEDLRKSIADKFKDMIVATGSCVLIHPTVERSLSTFLILIMIEISKELGQDWEKFKNFDYKTLIKIDSTAPFVHINEEKKTELKNNFKVDLEKNSDIIKSKAAILSFIETLNKFKEYFVELAEKTKKFSQDTFEIIKELKRQYNAEGKDKITLGQAIDYISIAEKNLEKVFDISNVLTLMGSLFMEIANTIYTLSQKIMHPKEIYKWERISADAVKKKIFDPKEIVFVYAMEEKCKRIQDWEQNITYREEEEELKF